LQNILKKVVKKFGRNKERVVSLYQAITLITLKQNIMTYEITTKFIATLTDQLQNTFMPKQVALLVQKEIDRLELTLQTV
jgi:hypothetical protein